ncbi:30S ribosomal protein S14 [Paremcibacter congregatus]|jgi:small subunit ribosomal protein S14|uniref:Small ribosomal subunit protein uS14 n=1 Tax=Paremcibacter congregatus TaxID=2043170 RepID=A0A2G4YMI6_9PROT|nr:30S ribosomal protein S14 [Paremcibacter congregatus]PHZ83531.1 30S ribosomal protein S14 [Paremcibacter congregatus]QDE28383.1 30S ribosomal protein S14 [Paremcibacter congregatus]|tara:strand:+ start:5398 stop:5703 length:306 start_codon:yes stop_codon:yes gene_type:complete
MAKVSAVEKNMKRERLVAKFAEKRAALKKAAVDPELSAEEQFMARLKLAKMPRNSAATRLRNRCQVTGRPRGYHRKFKMSRISLRDLASSGYLPGVTKSSW